MADESNQNLQPQANQPIAAQVLQVEVEGQKIALTPEQAVNLIKQNKGFTEFQTKHQASVAELQQTKAALQQHQELLKRLGVDPERVQNATVEADPDYLRYISDPDSPDEDYLDPKGVADMNRDFKDTRKLLKETQKQIKQLNSQRVLEKADNDLRGTLLEFRQSHAVRRADGTVAPMPQKEAMRIYYDAGQQGLLGENYGTEQSPWYQPTLEEFENAYDRIELGRIPDILRDGGNLDPLAKRLAQRLGLGEHGVELKLSRTPPSLTTARSWDQNSIDALIEKIKRGPLTRAEIESIPADTPAGKRLRVLYET